MCFLTKKGKHRKEGPKHSRDDRRVRVILTDPKHETNAEKRARRDREQKKTEKKKRRGEST